MRKSHNEIPASSFRNTTLAEFSTRRTKRSNSGPRRTSNDEVINDCHSSSTPDEKSGVFPSEVAEIPSPSQQNAGDTEGITHLEMNMEEASGGFSMQQDPNLDLMSLSDEFFDWRLQGVDLSGIIDKNNYHNRRTIYSMLKNRTRPS